MNCLEIRRLLYADPKSAEPSSDDEMIRQHLADCAECKQFANNLGSFESSLKSVSNVEVPDGLASRILLRQRLATGQNRRQRVAMATATVFLLGFIGVFSGFLTNGLNIFGSDSLEQVVLQHVNDELHHLNDHKNLSIEQLNSVLEGHASKIQALPGRTINYAGACPIRKNQGAHVIVDSDTGPITILFMTGEFVRGRSQLNDARFQGVIIPTEQGSMAIIGEDPQQIEQLERELAVQLMGLS